MVLLGLQSEVEFTHPRSLNLPPLTSDTTTPHPGAPPHLASLPECPLHWLPVPVPRPLQCPASPIDPPLGHLPRDTLPWPQQALPLGSQRAWASWPSPRPAPTCPWLLPSFTQRGRSAQVLGGIWCRRGLGGYSQTPHRVPRAQRASAGQGACGEPAPHLCLGPLPVASAWPHVCARPWTHSSLLPSATCPPLIPPAAFGAPAPTAW